MNSLNPKVAVVCAVYNAEQYIAATIESVLAQSYAGFKLVIVNDGSVDKTSSVIEGYRDNRISILNVPNGGVSKARNIGFQETQDCDYILFLDGDDILHFAALERMVQRLEREKSNTSCVAVRFPLVKFSETVEFSEEAVIKESDAEVVSLRRLLAKNSIVNGATLLIKREYIARVKGFDESLKLGEDWEFWCRLLLHGNIYFVETNPILAYRVHVGGANSQLRIGKNSEIYQHEACKTIKNNDEIATLVGTKCLNKLLRSSAKDSYWVKLKFLLASHEYVKSFFYVISGIVKYPESLLSLKRAYKLLFQ